MSRARPLIAKLSLLAAWSAGAGSIVSLLTCIRVFPQGRATVEMGLTFKTARDNGIKGGLIRIVRPCSCTRWRLYCVQPIAVALLVSCCLFSKVASRPVVMRLLCNCLFYSLGGNSFRPALLQSAPASRLAPLWCQAHETLPSANPNPQVTDEYTPVTAANFIDPRIHQNSRKTLQGQTHLENEDTAQIS